jgi:hypothetical protein
LSPFCSVEVLRNDFVILVPKIVGLAGVPSGHRVRSAWHSVCSMNGESTVKWVEESEGKGNEL